MWLDPIASHAVHQHSQIYLRRFFYWHAQVYGAGVAWAAHWAVARLLLRGMNVGGVAWSELLAYTGYPFVPVCIAIVLGFLAGEHQGWCRVLV